MGCKIACGRKICGQMKSNMLELRNITKSFCSVGKPLTVINRANLTLHPGDFAAIGGPSGSGKSTLLNLIGMLDKPDSGEVFIDGMNVSCLHDRPAAKLRNRMIGFIFQSFHLVPVLSALENVAYPMVWAGIPSKERRRRALDLLDKVGLKALASRFPGRLSGGERQRVAIARALACHPRIVLADEPTANLDQRTALEVIELLRNINESEKVTFLFSTHDLTVMSYAHRKLRLSDGMIFEEG